SSTSPISRRSVPLARRWDSSRTMDLGIAGRHAVLMASSRGLGRACAESLAREGVNIVVNGRDSDDVERAVAELRAAYDVDVVGVVGDSSTTEVHEALLDSCPNPDIVLLNGEGPAPAPFADLDEASLTAAFRQAVIGPVQFLQRVVPGMVERRFGRIVAVSSAMVKTPNPLMSLSHGTRLGLAGILKGLSREVVAHNVTVNQLLPERFDTGRQQQMAELVMKFKGVSYEEARAEQVASIRAGRLGRPEEFGDAFAYLCSAQAGYLSGQNLQLDGGSYEGVF
ncbi:MAG: SDR family oxidoreductase, partial [Ilumatobacteraceae bacterium]